MKYKKVYLKDLSSLFKDSEASIEYYGMEMEEEWFDPSFKRHALVIFPGGGYEFVSNREGEPIALRFLTEGFVCFVVKYTCHKEYPIPQREAIFALNYIKEHKDEFLLTDDNPSIIGFSAGGHLVGTIGLYYKEIAESLNINSSNVKPTSIIMGYPVITSNKEYGERGTIRVITGLKEELMEKMSLEKHVTKEYPPTYIFTTKEDTCVPPINSDLFASALKEKGVHYQYHLFDNGEHGGSLFSRGVEQSYDDKHESVESNSIWVKEAAKFIFDIVYKK